VPAGAVALFAAFARPETPMLKRRHTGERPTLTDPEVLAVLEDDPELLALADAIAATQLRTTRHWPVATALAAALAAVAVVLALVLTRSHSPSLVEEALAAVGDRPVIHAVIERSAPDNVVLDFRTGDVAPVLVELESWYDERSGQFRVITRHQSRMVADVRVRKSLPSGVDRTAAAFLSSYRHALESGRARARDTRLVVTANGVREQVTLDSARRPRAFASVEQPDAVWHVTLYASMLRDEGDFETSRPAVRPIAGRVVSSRGINRSDAARLLGPRLAARARHSGGQLRARRFQTLTSELSDGRTRRATGVEFVYESRSGLVRLMLARRPEPAYGYVEGRLTYSFNPLPPTEQLDLVRPSRAGSLWIGQARVAGFYVTVRAPSRQLAIATARALR
jgi:hypothetical protein